MMNCDDEDARQGVLETARPFRFKRLKNSAKKFKKSMIFLLKNLVALKVAPKFVV